MTRYIPLFLTLMLLTAAQGCTHTGQAQPVKSSEGSSALKTTDEEEETNIESPGISAEESDADVRIDF